MARLNEAPGPVESVDALKRRFVRQNRELARINSNQSVRIRNLESEISRLLSENIAFRERVIKLQHEVDKGHRQAAVDNVAAIRLRLEAKLAEIGHIVQDLGEAHGSLEIPRTSCRKSTQQSSPRKSPDQRNWKNTLTLSDVTGYSDIARLPPIAEDKYYPRRTLEREELLDILDAANATDSPELGPPPVASFDEGDPIKYDHSALPAEGQEGLLECDNMPMPGIANLETRKRRRESSHHTEVGQSRSSSQFEPQKSLIADIRLSLKAGAKRKVNVQEDDGNGILNVVGSEIRELGRKAGRSTATEPEKDPLDTANKSRASEYQNVSSLQERAKNPTSSSAIRARKALGPKSVNTDPLQSPVKIRKTLVDDKLADSKGQMGKKPRELEHSAAKPLSRRDEHDPKKGTSNEMVASKTQSATAEPEIPAKVLFDNLSSKSSEETSTRPKSRDTPPPADLNANATTTIAISEIPGRGTRRPRGSVSYAEPNLRDKMRRPTKELVDAVGAEDRVQVIRVDEIKSSVDDAESGKSGTIRVKREYPAEATSSVWKDLPLATDGKRMDADNGADSASPLNARSTHLGDNVAAERGPRNHDTSTEFDAQTSSSHDNRSTGTIAALVAGSQKARKREIGQLGQEDPRSRDLFELHTSSPSENILKETSPASTRASRRHSSASNSLNSDTLGPARKGSMACKGNRRKGGTLKPTAKEEGLEDTEVELSTVRSVDGLQRTASQNSFGRGERSANRRRSMML